MSKSVSVQASVEAASLQDLVSKLRHSEGFTLLVVGNEAALEAHWEQLLHSSLPGDVTEGLSTLKNGGSRRASSTLVGQHCVAYEVVSSQVSRVNCPTRPDLISKAVAKHCPEEGDYFIVVCIEDEGLSVSSINACAKVFPLYSRQSSFTSSAVHVTMCTLDAPEDFEVEKMNVLVDAIRDTGRLVDMPPNELHTDAFREHARHIALLTGSEYEEIVGTELRDRGYGGLWNVGMAADKPPALVILHHKAESSDAKRVALVGKGIIFDTGGLSIKGKFDMPGMKRDMGGAAALLNAFRVACLTDIDVDLYLLLCLAENSVSSVAMRPDDIIRIYSGLTVEVNNTDAEGRLVMADGIAHAIRHLDPDYIFNMATLTGAQAMATGVLHAGVVAPSEEVEQLVVRAGLVSGDVCFPMMYCPEFLAKELSSVVADMKNSARNRSNAGASVAAQFLANHMEEYLSQGKFWGHIDIAAPAHESERASGFGVSLISTILLILSQDEEDEEED